MLTIWKYEIPIKSNFSLIIPIEYKILDFKIQNGVPVIWALVNPESARNSISFCIYGTGHPIDKKDERKQYVGTIIDDSLVWHLFKENDGEK